MEKVFVEKFSWKMQDVIQESLLWKDVENTYQRTFDEWQVCRFVVGNGGIGKSNPDPPQYQTDVKGSSDVES
jgi:hypothetical protein